MIIDIVNTLIQSVMVNYFPYYFLNNGVTRCKDKEVFKLIVGTVITFMLVIILTNNLQNSSLSLISIAISNIIVIGFIYKKNYKKAILSYGIAYIFIQLPVILSTSILWPIIDSIFFNEETSKALGIYVPVIVLEIIVILKVKGIYSIYKEIIRYKYYFELSILTILSLDYVVCLSMVKLSWGNKVLSNITIFTFIIFILSVVVYIKNLNNRYDEIENLNKSLLSKNNELKKIKHDYGSQISYINGLYIMKQYERLGGVLQDIINGNESISSNIKYVSSNDSIVSTIVNSIDTKNINIVVDEEVNLNEINVNEYELHKIMANIINNAVTAIGDDGLVIVKTYRIFSSVYISIKNNGPQIRKEIIDKLFDLGFTTKNDNDNDHGYGLYITKELVEINNGKIYVKSNEDYTEFKIVFKDCINIEMENES